MLSTQRDEVTNLINEPGVTKPVSEGMERNHRLQKSGKDEENTSSILDTRQLVTFNMSYKSVPYVD